MNVVLCFLLLVLVSGQPFTNFTYFEQGRDWPGICNTGESQSPINIQDSPIDQSDITYVSAGNSSYVPIQLQYPVNSEYYTDMDSITLNVDNVTGWFLATEIGALSPIQFNLVNMHFHTPSAHTLNGQTFPMEMHMPHFAADGSVIVVAIWFVRSSTRSQLLDDILNGEPFDLTAELGTVLDDYYFYSGSVENPPCSEGITWVIPRFGSRVALPANWDQIEYFRRLWVENPAFAGGFGNDRPTEPLNGRTVYHFVSSPDDANTSFLT